MATVNIAFEPESKDSPAIAVVSGGEYDGEKIYLNQSETQPVKGGKRKSLSFAKAKMDKMKARDKTQMMYKLQEAYRKGIPPEHLQLEGDGVKEMYGEMIEETNNDKTIELPPDSTFQLLPSSKPTKREVWYIAGASGSGKSYIAKGLAEKYHKLFPQRPIYLVSKLAEDDTLDNMKGYKLIRLNLEKIAENPMKDLEDLRDCMIIFDDYDTFTKPLDKVVQKLMDDIATMGRHTNTTMLCLTHYLSNYAKTRLLLCEATHFVLYPQSTGTHALTYLLKTHLGLDTDEIAALRKMKTRWICIHKNYPIYIITEHSAKLMTFG